MISKRSDARWNGVFIISLVILIIVRWQYQIPTELDVDTSTWISSAISTAQSEHPLWTLMNFSDSRPLAVLPLAIVEMAGVKVDWALADGIGVMLWVVTLVFVFLIFKNWFSSAKSLLFTAPLLLFQTTHVWPGFMTYNSEHLCILMLTVGFWGIVKIQERVHSPWAYLLPGFWLGLLPFAKFQIIPMGLILAMFVGLVLTKDKQWIRLAFFVIGGLLPVLLVNWYYYQYDHIATFWNDYFWNYYYYSFSTVYSKLDTAYRFSPLTLGRAIFRPITTRIFWIVQLSIIVVGFISWIRDFSRRVAVSASMIWFSIAFALVSLYAVLQAGNPFDHYLLLLFVPSALVASFCSLYLSQKLFDTIWAVGLMAIALEGVRNILLFPIGTIPSLPQSDSEIRKAIQTYSHAGEKMTIWGYADRFFVYEHLPAGNRLPHSYWIYTESPLQTYRQREFIGDLEQNKPALFMDAMVENVSNIYLPEKHKYRHDCFPMIAKYIREHYRLVKEVDGVRFYRRKT